MSQHTASNRFASGTTPATERRSSADASSSMPKLNRNPQGYKAATKTVPAAGNTYAERRFNYLAEGQDLNIKRSNVTTETISNNAVEPILPP